MCWKHCNIETMSSMALVFLIVCTSLKNTMSLYRKYRPLDFATLLGQDHIREVLQGALKLDKVSHAYLFTGPRGTGKTSTARILARAINCTDLQKSGPCNACEICRAALEERLTDMVEIDAASHGLVDDARALVEQARFMPVQAKKKIYIIDEVHMLSKSAFNALLKIIEEPPEHVHFILATTEAHKVLDTIKSRCQRFDFHLASDELIVQSLDQVCRAEKAKAAPEALQLLAQHARGSFRDALSLLEQVINAGNLTLDSVSDTLGLSEESVVQQFVDHLVVQHVNEALQLVRGLHEQGLDLYQFCQSVLEHLRALLIGRDSRLPVQKLLAWVDVFFVALDQLRDPVIPELPLEMAIMKCCEGGIGSSELKQEASAQPAKPRKIVQKPSSESSVQPEADRAVAKTSSQSDGFDRDAFIESIQHASLKRVLKYSQLEFDGKELRIFAQTGFELERIKDRPTFEALLDTMKVFFGPEITVHLDVTKKPEEKKSKPEGIRIGDVQSVF